MSGNAFRDRVRAAAEAALEAGGSVGPLELLQQMRLLEPVHFENWRKGNPHYRTIEEHIQVGPEKFGKTLRYFREWIEERGLHPLDAPYIRQTPRGAEPLPVTVDGEPKREQFYRTRYVPAGLTEPKAKRLREKLAKAPDLIVFEQQGDEGKCTECGTALAPGSFVFMERDRPLCLACADLDHLVLLPAGDTALSRRARKHSPLCAVAVRFNRRRRRCERLGLLVTNDALDRAEAECAGDAPERAARRAQASLQREAEDREFVRDMTAALLELFPGCPPAEARAIAGHTGRRGSGCVGRSAAGRVLDRHALELAVRAHIRHQHTRYDSLLMQGTERMEARAQVQAEINRLAAAWSGGP